MTNVCDKLSNYKTKIIYPLQCNDKFRMQKDFKRNLSMEKFLNWIVLFANYIDKTRNNYLLLICFKPFIALNYWSIAWTLNTWKWDLCILCSFDLPKICWCNLQAKSFIKNHVIILNYYNKGLRNWEFTNYEFNNGL